MAVSRLRRSELSTPGWSERMIAKAAASDADLVFLDLEDSVAPVAKPAAREKVAAALRGLDWGTKTRAVRINGAGSGWAEADLAAVLCDHLDVVILPKARSAEDVRWLDSRLAGTGVGIEVLIEEVEALLAVNEIAHASPRLEALIFGSGDMAASQGVRTGRLGSFRGDPWIYHRTRVVVAARSAGIAAIDGPSWAPLADVDAYRAECELAATLGYDGKWAIHPSQIEPANEAFSPSPEEVAHAERVLAAFASAAEGRGAIALDGVMVDAVDIRLGQQVLELHRQTQRRPA
jgi:citrate lyase subunit beta / citryl-CoA lyase